MTTQHPRHRYAAAALLLFTPVTALLAPLAGCGAARGIINSQIPAIADPARLDGRQFPAEVGADGVARGVFTGPFADQGRVSNQERLSFAELRQPLRPEITLVPPSGSGAVTPPAQVTLRGLELRVRVYEGPAMDAAPTREVVFPVLAAGGAPLIFTNVPGTARYTLPTADLIPLGPERLSGDNARRLFDLLTGTGADGSTSNFVQASFSATVEGGTLPEGSRILFTFGPGEARVGL